MKGQVRSRICVKYGDEGLEHAVQVMVSKEWIRR
jgi:hypothetical protein